MSALNFYDDLTFEIEGHTDDVGSERDNFLISVERAKAVEVYLRDQGIDPARMSVRGYGEIRPIGDNTTSEGRDRNRRIEILVTGVLEVPEEAVIIEDDPTGGEVEADDLSGEDGGGSEDSAAPAGDGAAEASEGEAGTGDGAATTTDGEAQTGS